MTVEYFPDLQQGSDEWLAARCGLLTASEMKHILTPTLKVASNDKERAHVWEIAAQRITKFVEPSYISDDMLRGTDDEILAREAYAQNYAPVQQCGFIVRNFGDFAIGASPDGLVGDDGLIECKSRRQKFQLETIVSGECPTDYFLQVQTLLLVSGRKWLDFISYSGGMPMVAIRVMPDDLVHAAIFDAAEKFEERVTAKIAAYHAVHASGARLIPTERRIEQEMHL